MKYSIIFVVMLMFLVPVYADNETGEEETSAGTTPDSPFYFLDTFIDDLRLALVNGEEAKVKMQLDIAEERLAEVKAMSLKGDINAMMKAEGNHEKIFIKIRNKLEESENGTEVDEEIRSKFEHHNTEVTRIRGDLDIMIKTKGDLTAEQEAAIEVLIASFEGKEGKIKININNDNGRATIKVKSGIAKGDDNETEEDNSSVCFGLDEASCISEEKCAPFYEPGTCISNTTLAVCDAEDVFMKCVESLTIAHRAFTMKYTNVIINEPFLPNYDNLSIGDNCNSYCMNNAHGIVIFEDSQMYCKCKRPTGI